MNWILYLKWHLICAFVYLVFIQITQEFYLKPLWDKMNGDKLHDRALLGAFTIFAIILAPIKVFFLIISHVIMIYKIIKERNDVETFNNSTIKEPDNEKEIDNNTSENKSQDRCDNATKTN